MKNATKLFLVTLATTILSLPILRAEETAPAGAPPAPSERREHRGERMKEMGERMAKELGLTAEQQTQMKALMLEEKNAADAVRADATLTQDQKRDKMKEIRQSFQTKRQALMTPEQRRKADEMRANRPEGGPRHKGEAGPETK